MNITSPGQIYLADQRGITEMNGATRCSTFNYAQYEDEGRKPFGALLTLNDEVFMPGHKAAYKAWQAVWSVIIPITGEVKCIDDLDNSAIIDVGQVKVRYVPAGNVIELANPYTDEQINFLYMEFKANEFEMATLVPKIYNFDIEGNESKLLDVVATDQPTALHDLPFSLHIGMFMGRKEALIPVKDGELFFAFVIAGAFELQGRLMHQRDGLALWDLHQADIEALSNNAVVLIMQIKKQA